MEFNYKFLTWSLLVLLMGGAALVQGAITLTGAGATFPAPLYFKWAEEYNKVTNGQVQINYQSIGSGGGIQQIIAKTVDFGASDAPMSEADFEAAGARVLHFPTVLGAVVPTYNLEGNPRLRFTGKLLADIFLGRITKWNDPAIASLNPEINLPDEEITVVHRSDGSGTTFIFVEYLSKVSEEWKERVGVGKTVNWPVGLGGKGNEGVTGLVTQIPGALGYVELIYAIQNELPLGQVQNRSGKFIEASLETVTLAASGVEIPEDFIVSLTDTANPDAWPIASFTWLLIYPELNMLPQMTKGKAEALGQFLLWALDTNVKGGGQEIAPTLLYAPLSPDLSTKIVEAIKTKVTFNGEPIVQVQ